jgi:hypothetical protein
LHTVSEQPMYPDCRCRITFTTSVSNNNHESARNAHK